MVVIDSGDQPHGHHTDCAPWPGAVSPFILICVTYLHATTDLNDTSLYLT